jgi:hypothetical protein
MTLSLPAAPAARTLAEPAGPASHTLAETSPASLRIRTPFLHSTTGDFDAADFSASDFLT